MAPAPFAAPGPAAGLAAPASSETADEIRPPIDEIMSLTETVTTPAGTYTNCIKEKEVLADGEIEYKYYAKGVGVVREVPGGGDVLLVSHTGMAAKPAK